MPMIRACGPRLVLKVDDVESEEKFSTDGEVEIVVVQDDKRVRKAAVEKGVVQSVGQTCWKAFYYGFEEEFEPWCKVGDYISFVRYAGRSIMDPADDEIYQIINDEDVVTVIETKEERDGRANS
jgi:co-chaperonin GroES (HSP10)